jgi:hypothetical protein
MAFLNWRYQVNALIQLTWCRFAEFRTGFGPSGNNGQEG